MVLSCIIKDTNEVIDAFNYNPSIHSKLIVDKFTGNPLIFRQGHYRLGDTYVKPHFYSKYYGEIPKHLDFDSEYFKLSNNKYYLRESPSHIQGKFYVASMWEKDSEFSFFEFEKLIKIPSKKYRIADVYVESKSGYKIVNEIQVSLIDKDIFLERTHDYLDLGIDVVWWFNENIYPRYSNLHADTFGFYPYLLSFYNENKS